MTYTPPEQPTNPGPFAPQHGYADIQIKEVTYKDRPDPLNPTTHHKPGNIESFAKNDKTKKAGNFVLGQLKGFLLSKCT